MGLKRNGHVGNLIIEFIVKFPENYPKNKYQIKRNIVIMEVLEAKVLDGVGSFISNKSLDAS